LGVILDERILRTEKCRCRSVGLARCSGINDRPCSRTCHRLHTVQLTVHAQNIRFALKYPPLIAIAVTCIHYFRLETIYDATNYSNIRTSVNIALLFESIEVDVSAVES
jgi:hypothetical protein